MSGSKVPLQLLVLMQDWCSFIVAVTNSRIVHCTDIADIVIVQMHLARRAFGEERSSGLAVGTIIFYRPSTSFVMKTNF